MPLIALTAAFVSSASSPGGLTEYRDAKTPGLGLRVSPGGTKAWTIRYRSETGDQKRLNLGRYPAVSLADARERALIALGHIAAGRDPVHEKQGAKVAATAARITTVRTLAEAYFADAMRGRHRPAARQKRQTTIALEQYYWNRILRPSLGDRPLTDVNRAEAQAFINWILDHHSLSTARQSRNLLRQIFAYAIWHDRLAANPIQLVEVPRFRARERILRDDEIRVLWSAVSKPKADGGPHLSPEVALCFQLLFLTLQRRGEVAGLHTREVDWIARTWTIPSDRTKNHRTHVVPLSGRALSILEEARSLRGGAEYEGYLFPSPRRENTHVAPQAISKAMRRLTAALGLVDARPHDLRRTGATRLTDEAIGTPRFVVSQVLNHASDTDGSAAVTGIYDRGSYMPQKRRALEAWACELGRIAADCLDTNVIRLDGLRA